MNMSSSSGTPGHSCQPTPKCTSQTWTIVNAEIKRGITTNGNMTPEYVTGISFQKETLETILKPPMRRFGDGIQVWTPPTDIRVEWRPQNDLLAPGVGVGNILATLFPD